MNYRIVDLGRDYAGKITDWSRARNSFLEELGPHQWIFWKSHDEEITRMLAKYLAYLKPAYPYYWVRRVNLYNGRFQEWANPDFQPLLCSGQVRFKGSLHEHVIPRKPHGLIDYPVIHNQNGSRPYHSGWKQTVAYRPVHAMKKAVEVLRGR